MKARIILILVLISNFSLAQTAQDNREIMETINGVFKGMNLGDSAMVHASFIQSPTLVSVFKDKDGVPQMRTGGFQKWLDAVGTPHEEKWSEPIWEVKIQMDGNMAQAWMKYAFYLGKTFHHCGADAFQLFKGPDGKWRIFHLADTRATEGCNVPPAIANQFK
ncbi:MAG TPA: nuclear transport factor 2 family protein [Cyclobacteriaceae bacterium]|nr:nuclear transport factor 2 family protein [Cyclobacteriaceae bacterium]